MARCARHAIGPPRDATLRWRRPRSGESAGDCTAPGGARAPGSGVSLTPTQGRPEEDARCLSSPSRRSACRNSTCPSSIATRSSARSRRSVARPSTCPTWSVPAPRSARAWRRSTGGGSTRPPSTSGGPWPGSRRSRAWAGRSSARAGRWPSARSSSSGWPARRSCRGTPRSANVPGGRSRACGRGSMRAPAPPSDSRSRTTPWPRVVARGPRCRDPGRDGRGGRRDRDRGRQPGLTRPRATTRQRLIGRSPVATLGADSDASPPTPERPSPRPVAR